MIFKVIVKICITLILTVITQIGGVLYLLIEVLYRKKDTPQRLKKIGIFLISYSILSFIVVPLVAPIFGRKKINNTDTITSHSFVTELCNRNYVTPKLHRSLEDISERFQKAYPGIKIVYLDANFPFFDGFPLPPHLSHDDGEKIDLSFIYSDHGNKLTNKKPAFLGYGSFVDPKTDEYNQNKICKNKGYWNYDIAKYLTLGISNSKLKFSERATKDLLLTIIKQPEVRKIFIEPHIKQRLGLMDSKIRFHGCQAVRHDDHIHIQL